MFKYFVAGSVFLGMVLSTGFAWADYGKELREAAEETVVEDERYEHPEDAFELERLEVEVAVQEWRDVKDGDVSRAMLHIEMEETETFSEIVEMEFHRENGDWMVEYVDHEEADQVYDRIDEYYEEKAKEEQRRKELEEDDSLEGRAERRAQEIWDNIEEEEKPWQN